MDALDSLLNPLKPLLHPIVTNLPTPLHSFALSLLGEKCTASVLHNLDFSSSNQECVKLGISKALGIGIIAASSIVKIPQLLKLVSSQSATGLSFSSYVLETLSFLITLAYSVRSGFPFSTFGETALIAVQDVVIAALILVYSGRGAAAGVFVAGVAALVYALLGPGNIVGADLLRTLQAGAGLLGIASKVPQIYTIWKEGTTGQLSAFAVSWSRLFVNVTTDGGLRCCISRCSTTSPAHCLASSPPSKKSPTQSSFTVTSQDSRSTLSSPSRCCTTGMHQRAKGSTRRSTQRELNTSRTKLG